MERSWKIKGPWKRKKEKDSDTEKIGKTIGKKVGETMKKGKKRKKESQVKTKPRDGKKGIKR